MSDLPRERRVELVLASIERIERAEAAWKAGKLNASSGCWERDALKWKFQATEREFFRQWRNVREILKGADNGTSKG